MKHEAEIKKMRGVIAELRAPKDRKRLFCMSDILEIAEGGTELSGEIVPLSDPRESIDQVFERLRIDGFFEVDADCFPIQSGAGDR